MRPVLGVTLELVALSAALIAVEVRPIGGILGVLVLLALQAVTVFLVYCPAHYFVGTALGVKFRSFSVARSTMIRGCHPSLPDFRLSVGKKSVNDASGRRLRAMFMSGAVASTCSGLAIMRYDVRWRHSCFSRHLALFAVPPGFGLGSIAQGGRRHEGAGGQKNG